MTDIARQLEKTDEKRSGVVPARAYDRALQPEGDMGIIGASILRASEGRGGTFADSEASVLLQMPGAQRASMLRGLQRTRGNSHVQRAVSQLRAITDRKSYAGEWHQWTQEEKPKQNKTGMPDQLKASIELLSGMDMSDVRVQGHSAKPAKLDALAYAQGNEIYLGPNQERHLPHEAWHVVQQKQGRVKPTLQANGVEVNDDPRLEQEADVMVSKALRMPRNSNGQVEPSQGSSGSEAIFKLASNGPKTAQLMKQDGVTAKVNEEGTVMQAKFTIEDKIAGTKEEKTLTVSLRRHWWHGLAPDSAPEEANSLMGYNVTKVSIEKDVFDLAVYYRHEAKKGRQLETFMHENTTGRTYRVNKVNTQLPHSYPISGSDVNGCSDEEFAALKDIKLMIDGRYKENEVETAKASVNKAGLPNILTKLVALKVPQASEVNKRFKESDIQLPGRDAPRENKKVRWERDKETGQKIRPKS